MSQTANTSSARKLPRGQESIAFRIFRSPVPNECGPQQHKVPIPRAATRRLMSVDHFINVLRVCLTFSSVSVVPFGASVHVYPRPPCPSPSSTPAPASDGAGPSLRLSRANRRNSRAALPERSIDTIEKNGGRQAILPENLSQRF